MNKLTQEQQKVVDTVLSATDERIIAVNSIAGSGKTSTASAVINAYKPKNGFYTAFNKAIVTDSSRRFGNLLDCKTIHALAYSHIKPSKGIEDLTYLSIKEPISYEAKAKIIEIIDDFYRSSSLDINNFSASRTDNEDIQQLVFEYTSRMLEGKIPVTFNYMLKCLHLMLAHKEIEIDYDLLILDECLTEDMLVTTSTGERTIKSIVNSLLRNEKVLVKSFNQNSKEFEFKEASNPLISHNRDVIEIRTEGLNKIKCTPNHKIFTQRGYVKAEDLVIGKDFVLLDNPNNQKTKAILNNEQYQIMLGSYLGDGSLNKRSKYNTYRLKFTQGIKQLNYLKWKADAFKLRSSIHEIKSGYTGKCNVFQTNSSNTFILEDTPFNLVLKDLNELGLAIWFMDDGSKDRISSNNFSEIENNQLKEMLFNKFKIQTEVKPDGKGYFYLSLDKENKHLLFKTIFKYLHEDLFYKFEEEKEFPEVLNSFNSEYENYGGNFVTSKKYIGKQTVYDFEVEDNHNFVTSKSKNSSKTIVHNCQDTTAVTLEIFKLMQANRKIMFGDKFQNIYSFMNTVNAFDELNDLNLIRLTKSFRCNPYVADIVEQFGTSYLEDDFMFKGNEDMNNAPKSMAYISRTNAALIERMHELLNKGVTFSLTRHVNDIFALPIAVANAACGNVVYDKKYKYLETEYRKYSSSPKTFKSFYEHLIYTVDDVSITNTIKTLMSFANKRINIFKLKESVKNIRSNPNIILTTAHAFKGLEADMVYIEDDLNSSVNKTIQTIKDNITMFDNEFTTDDFLTSSQKEDLNTYYVALSRARSGITNVNYIG